MINCVVSIYVLLVLIKLKYILGKYTKTKFLVQYCVIKTYAKGTSSYYRPLGRVVEAKSGSFWLGRRGINSSHPQRTIRAFFALL